MAQQIASPATVGEPIAVWHDEGYEPVITPNQTPDPAMKLPGFDSGKAKWKIGYAIGVDKLGRVTNVAFSDPDLPVGRSNLKMTLGIGMVLVMGSDYHDVATSLVGRSFSTKEALADEIVSMRKESLKNELE